mgnify:CR=1 FL=1
MRHKGVLDGFEIGRKEAEDLILAARDESRLQALAARLRA